MSTPVPPSLGPLKPTGLPPKKEEGSWFGKLVKILTGHFPFLDRLFNKTVQQQPSPRKEITHQPPHKAQATQRPSTSFEPPSSFEEDVVAQDLLEFVLTKDKELDHTNHKKALNKAIHSYCNENKIQPRELSLAHAHIFLKSQEESAYDSQIASSLLSDYLISQKAQEVAPKLQAFIKNLSDSGNENSKNASIKDFCKKNKIDEDLLKGIRDFIEDKPECSQELKILNTYLTDLEKKNDEQKWVDYFHKNLIGVINKVRFSGSEGQIKNAIESFCKNHRIDKEMLLKVARQQGESPALKILNEYIAGLEGASPITQQAVAHKPIPSQVPKSSPPHEKMAASVEPKAPTSKTASSQMKKTTLDPSKMGAAHYLQLSSLINVLDFFKSEKIPVKGVFYVEGRRIEEEIIPRRYELTYNWKERTSQSKLLQQLDSLISSTPEAEQYLSELKQLVKKNDNIEQLRSYIEGWEKASKSK